MEDIGFVGIKFKENTSQDDVKKIITELFSKNIGFIDGMWYLQIKDNGSMKYVKKHIENIYKT